MRKLTLAVVVAAAAVLAGTIPAGAQTAEPQTTECVVEDATARCNQVSGLLGTALVVLLLGLIGLFMFLNRPARINASSEEQQDSIHTQ